MEDKTTRARPPGRASTGAECLTNVAREGATLSCHRQGLGAVMPHWKRSFPSRYLQVSDLDTPIVATIAAVQDEEVGSGDDAESKPVVHFKTTPRAACSI